LSFLSYFGRDARVGPIRAGILTRVPIYYKKARKRNFPSGGDFVETIFVICRRGDQDEPMGLGWEAKLQAAGCTLQVLRLGCCRWLTVHEEWPVEHLSEKLLRFTQIWSVDLVDWGFASSA